MNKIVILTDEQLKEAEFYGKKRHHLHDGVFSPRMDTSDPYAEHIKGVKGELAWETLSGTKMDREEKTNRSGDSYDFQECIYVDIANERLRMFYLDVKISVSAKFMRVKIRDREKPVNLYVQAKLIDDRTVEFLGWQWKNAVMSYPIIHHKYMGDCWEVPVKDLRDINELLERLPAFYKSG